MSDSGPMGETPASGERVYDAVGEGPEEGIVSDGPAREGLEDDEESLTDDDALASEGDVTNIDVDGQHG